MRLKEILEQLIQEANKRIEEDALLRKVLKSYMGRRLVFNIKDEVTYGFNITPEGISLETEKELEPKPGDMYIEMSSDRAERLIRQRRLRLVDLAFIEHKNITIREIKLAKELHRRYLSRPTQSPRTKSR